MTGIHLGKSKRRVVVSWVRREQNGAGQRVAASGCVSGLRLGFPPPICSLFRGGGEEVGGGHCPKPLTREQSNCFKMVSPPFCVRLIKVTCVCLRNNQTK